MTKAHINTTLATKNRVLAADEHTTFLAHYDLTEHDVLRGVKAIGESESALFGTTYFIPKGQQYKITNNITMSAWVYPTAAPSNDRGTLFINSSGYYFTVDTSYKVGAYWYGKSPAGYHTSTGTCPLNTWTHIAVVWDDAGVNIYINGVLDTHVASTGTGTNSETLYIGSEFTSSRHFKGKVNELGIWAGAKTAEQIREIMRTGIAKNESGLRGFWTMNEGEGEILRDSSSFHQDIFPEPNRSFTWAGGSSVFTLRKQEGKFGGGIAIEEGTTNLSKHSTTNDLTPVDYEVIASYYLGQGQVNLTGNGFTNSYNHNAKYSSDIPPGAIEKRSIEFTHAPTAGSVAFGWFGTKDNMSVTAGDWITFSCWIKFLDAVPAPAWNRGFKSHTSQGTATMHNSWLNNCRVGEWHYVTSTFQATTTVTNERLILIFDDMPANHRLVFCDFQVEKKSFATSFVDGSRPNPYLAYPNVINGEQGTISFWVKFLEPVATSNRRDILQVRNYAGNANDRLVIYKPSANALNVHLFRAGVQQCSITGDITGKDNLMYVTFTWQSGRLAFFIDGVKIGESLNQGMINQDYLLRMIEWDYALPSNYLLDELRIDSVARTDEEILAWYESNSPFWPRGIYRKPY